MKRRREKYSMYVIHGSNFWSASISFIAFPSLFLLDILWQLEKIFQFNFLSFFISFKHEEGKSCWKGFRLFSFISFHPFISVLKMRHTKMCDELKSAIWVNHIFYSINNQYLFDWLKVSTHFTLITKQNLIAFG